MRYTQEQISTALVLLKATGSPDKVVQTLGYPSAPMLYHWRKKYPEYYDVPNQKHWRQAPTELKHDVIKHCLIKGEPVKLVAEEIGYTPSLIYSRFDNPKQIQKLAGYAIVACSSGKHKGESHISYRGRKRLRYVLYEAAISLIGQNAEFKEIHRYYLTRQNNPLKKMESVIAVACKALEILSADAIDLDIRRQTTDPKIGFDFFNVDDDTFKEALESKKNDEVIAIKARCKEEAIYCTINELWMQGENRPIFIVKNEEDWKSLLQIKDAGNIYIPWFYSDQIVTIPNNTNIFVFTERVPSFIKGEITLRPRTYSTISASLQRAGMGINEANKLVSETHGLFIPLKKKLFNGAYLKEPRWINGLQRNIKETALLIGQWTDCDGDKAVIESLSGIKYQDFISEIKEYAKDEDPFIHIVDINSTKEYYLASAENAWDYIDVDNDSEIWNKFKDVLLEVINEAEKLFIYSSQEKLVAQFKGEKFFWSLCEGEVFLSRSSIVGLLG